MSPTTQTVIAEYVICALNGYGKTRSPAVAEGPRERAVS